MFRWKLSCIKLEGTMMKLYPLAYWNPIDWVLFSFKKYKTFKLYKAPTLIGKTYDSLKDKYTFFVTKDKGSDIWLISDCGKHCCLLYDYSDVIRRIVFFIDPNNIQGLIMGCKKYAAKHDFRMEIIICNNTMVEIDLIGYSSGGSVDVIKVKK